MERFINAEAYLEVNMLPEMPRLQRTVYSARTLDKIMDLYKSDQHPEVDMIILFRTVSYSLTKTRDALSDLEEMAQDPKTVRGNSTHMARINAKKGKPLEVQMMNGQTDSIRREHFGPMTPLFDAINYDTDRLGAAVELLTAYSACRLGKTGTVDKDIINRVIQFSPIAQYNLNVGKIEYSMDGSNYFQLTSFPEYGELKQSIGGNQIMLSLLELKIASSALKVRIDSDTLQVSTVKDYPDDLHSEVMDAVQAVEGNLGFLREQELPGGLQAGIKRAIPSRITELSQTYMDHRMNPWFARIVGGLGLITGTASLVLGIPQILYWVSQGAIDLTYTPELPSEIGRTTALALTSYGLSAIIFSGLTLGSEIGSKLVRDMRKLELRKLKEI